MTIDLTRFSESILQETEEARYKREIRDNSSEIARQLKDKGVYENPVSGLRIAIARTR
jgi:hypothetical protein